jgi:quercetin dioxygenase-like cupin family protein
MRVAHANLLGTVFGTVFGSAIAFAVAIAAESEGEPVKLSPQYYTVKSDNERVRVLEYRLKPGEKETMHSHPAYVIYFFGAGNLRATLGDGKAVESSVTEGEILVRDPLTHAVENIGTTELHALLIELKSGASK